MGTKARNVAKHLLIPAWAFWVHFRWPSGAFQASSETPSVSFSTWHTSDAWRKKLSESAESRGNELSARVDERADGRTKASRQQQPRLQGVLEGALGQVASAQLERKNKDPYTQPSEPLLFPKFRIYVCQLPLPALFYRPEAARGGSTLSCGGRGKTGQMIDSVAPRDIEVPKKRLTDTRHTYYGEHDEVLAQGQKLACSPEARSKFEAIAETETSLFSIQTAQQTMCIYIYIYMYIYIYIYVCTLCIYIYIYIH